MSTHQLFFDNNYTNASSVQIISSEVLAVNASGIVPVEVFNRIESRQAEPEAVVSGEPFFGANIRDAIRIVRGWRTSPHGPR